MKTAPGTKKHCTVWLEPELDVTGKDKIKLFRCFNCTRPVIEYFGDVAKIVPGGQPYEPSTLLKCKGNAKHTDFWEECGMYYIFQAVVFSENMIPDYDKI